jgi:hypothetical protein
MSSSGTGDGTGERERRDTTISVSAELRDELRARKRGQERYSDLLWRMLDGFEDTYDPVADAKT